MLMKTHIRVIKNRKKYHKHKEKAWKYKQETEICERPNRIFKMKTSSTGTHRK